MILKSELTLLDLMAARQKFTTCVLNFPTETKKFKMHFSHLPYMKKIWRHVHLFQESCTKKKKERNEYVMFGAKVFDIIGKLSLKIFFRIPCEIFQNFEV